MEISPEIRDQENLYSRTSSSSFHFNSFLGLLTSDDDDEDDDTNQDAYIEIALEPPQVPWPPSLPQSQDQEERPLNDQQEELQLRISFSSRVFPFPGFSSSPSALCSKAVHAYATTNSNSCPDDQAIGSENSIIQGTPKIRFRAAVNRLLRFFPSTLNISTPPVSGWELVGSRGEVNMTTSSTGRSGVVGNFLVKLKATTFQIMMTSLLKLRQFTSFPPEKMSRRDIHQLKPRNTQMLIVKPFKKLFRRMQNTQRGMGSSKSCIISKTGGNIQRSSAIDVINLEGSKEAGRPDGVISMKRAISSSKGGEKKTKSCPASVKSSPTKENFSYELGGGGSSRSQKTHCARDNSVQAAIAHCKKSLERADDFHF